MRSPVSRVAAATVFVFAIAGVALWFHGGAAPALADFIEPILEAKTAKFKVTTEVKGPPAATIRGEVMVLDATRMRQEMEAPNMPKGIMIFDWGRGKSLTLDPATKKAMVVSLANLTKEQVARQDIFAWFRSVLLDARDKPDVIREPLGEMDIDGRRVVGFRINSRAMVVSLWGDPKTGQPVRVEATMAPFPDAKTTMSDFVFNVDMDESQFSVEPPAGYTVQNMEVDVSPTEEKDLIAAFRIYSELSNGVFPDSLEMQTMMQNVAKMAGMKDTFQVIREKSAPKMSEEQWQKFEILIRKMMDWQFAPEKEKPRILAELEKLEKEMRETGDWEGAKAQGFKKPSKEQMRKLMESNMKKVMEVQTPIQRGLLFAFALPPEADAHYAGKGVSLGAVNTPIFWYRPKDAENYRVIYADLSVRDALAAPSVPNAQPVPAPSSPHE